MNLKRTFSMLKTGTTTKTKRIPKPWGALEFVRA
jgi:hypothetical protein